MLPRRLCRRDIAGPRPRWEPADRSRPGRYTGSGSGARSEHLADRLAKMRPSAVIHLGPNRLSTLFGISSSRASTLASPFLRTRWTVFPSPPIWSCVRCRIAAGHYAVRNAIGTPEGRIDVTTGEVPLLPRSLEGVEVRFVEVTVNRRAAAVDFAGAAYGLVGGVWQINARLDNLDSS